MSLDAARKALRDALLDERPFLSLRSATKVVLAEHGHDVTYDLLEAMRKDFEDAGDEASENVVLNVMDCLVGWGKSLDDRVP